MVRAVMAPMGEVRARESKWEKPKPLMTMVPTARFVSMVLEGAKGDDDGNSGAPLSYSRGSNSL